MGDIVIFANGVTGYNTYSLYPTAWCILLVRCSFNLMIRARVSIIGIMAGSTIFVVRNIASTLVDITEVLVLLSYSRLF